MSWYFFGKRGMISSKGGRKMDQQKVGALLRALRKEKNVTQEQLAETLGVSNRSVSRWENGKTLPDFDLLLELAKYYGVGVGEILAGERNVEIMDEKTEKTINKVAEYTSGEKDRLRKRIHLLFWAGTVGFLCFMAVDVLGLGGVSPYEEIGSVGLGLSFGMILAGLLFTSRHAERIRRFKRKLLRRNIDQLA